MVNFNTVVLNDATEPKVEWISKFQSNNKRLFDRIGEVGENLSFNKNQQKEI